MIKDRVTLACLREVEALARMTEQQRVRLKLLWLKLEDVQVEIQSSKSAKEVQMRKRSWSKVPVEAN